MENTIRHSAEEIAQYPSIIDQYEFRKEAILEALENEGISISKLRRRLWAGRITSTNRRRNVFRQ